MKKISTTGKYIVGVIVFLYIIYSAIGAIISLGMAHTSLLIGTIYLLLSLTALCVAYSGYTSGLHHAEDTFLEQLGGQPKTKKRAWLTFLASVFFGIALSYGISFLLGYLLGLFVK